MIAEYSKLGCPVIEYGDLNRAILKLPTREQCNKETKSDTHTVFLDGDVEKAVMFDWDVTANQWRLRNRVVFKISPVAHSSYCECSPKDGGRQTLQELRGIKEHTINKDVTKKRCNMCGKVSDLIVMEPMI